MTSVPQASLVRAVAGRTCTTCLAFKPRDAFNKMSQARDGLYPSCRVCRAAARARPEAARIAASRTLAWRQANPERSRESIRRSTRKNAARVAAYLAAWHAANPDKVRVHRLTRRGLINSASRVPFTHKQLIARMDYLGNKCWMCGGAFEHVDHVKPLSKGGAHVLSNLRPACAYCNLSKNDKWFGPGELSRFVKSQSITIRPVHSGTP